MAIKNYTSKVAASVSVTEIIALLVQAGAESVQIRYESREPSALAFALETPVGQRSFVLPANVAGVLTVMQRDYRPGVGAHTGPPTAEQAKRTAWRILKDWVDAQLAIVDAGLVTLPEIMTPYQAVGGGLTLYQALITGRMELPLLPAPRES